jgi:hypothetical protein
MMLGSKRNFHILTLSMLNLIWTQKPSTNNLFQITALNRNCEAGRICHNYRVNDPSLTTRIFSFGPNKNFQCIKSVQI